MKRNGFTLIELLAVIVILAIIALIATPIVLNIINGAKTSSNERSGELYVKAVENAIMKKQMSGTVTVEDGEYTVQSDGSICIVSNNACESGTTITIDVEGDTPESGTITVSNGVVTAYTLVVSGTSVTKGESSDDSTDTICTLVSGTSKSEGAKYSCKVNDTDTFYFYVLGDEDDNYINLIMDRNICSSGKADTDGSCVTAWNSIEQSNDYGPTTALSYLSQATNDWTNIDYDYGTYVDDSEKYSLSLSGYHARLPKLSDIYDGTLSEFKDEEGDGFYIFNESKYYLFDNTMYACANSDFLEVSCNSNEVVYTLGVNKEGITHISGIQGYWTFLANYRVNGMGTAWSLNIDENCVVASLSNIYREDVGIGIRPVITISKNQLN